MTHDVHANYASDWQTPKEWVEWARATMGRIDLDPCAAPSGPAFFDGTSDVWFAMTNYSLEPMDGLVEPWHGRVYVNPPGSNSIRSVKAWWAKAIRELQGDLDQPPPRVTALTWCFFNCEAPRALCPSPFDLPGWMVIPDRRVAFWRDGRAIKSPRNWTWFWTTEHPASPPVASWVVGTGEMNIAALSKPDGKNGASDGHGNREAQP